MLRCLLSLPRDGKQIDRRGLRERDAVRCPGLALPGGHSHPIGPNRPERAYLDVLKNVWRTDQFSDLLRYMATSSAANLNPRPSAMRSALIGYFGRLGLMGH